MTRYILGLVSMTGLMWTGMGVSQAQPPAPGMPRPTFSPYLNLVRPGANPAVNYYGLVRPEMQFRRSIQNLQNSVATTQQMLGTVQAEMGGVPSTGHPTQFLNYGGYFLNSGPSAGAAGQGGFFRAGAGQGVQNFNPPSAGPRR